MTSRELRRLSRKDLLEMMLSLSKENARLREQLADSQKQQGDRRISVEKSDSLAEAAPGQPEIFEAAILACDGHI